MEFNISAQHTVLTPALEEAVREKFLRFQDHANKPLQAHVVLRVDNGHHVVDAKITGLDKTLVAKVEHKDMYAAINEASRLIDRQWRKNKTSKLANRRKGRLKDFVETPFSVGLVAETSTMDAYDESLDDEGMDYNIGDTPSGPTPRF